MDPYIGEIRIFPYPLHIRRVPPGWFLCNGQVLKISEYQALCAIIGVTYGGNYEEGTFALPNLMGYAPVGAGQGPGLSKYSLGQATGEESVSLNLAQFASHSHDVSIKPVTAATVVAANPIIVPHPSDSDFPETPANSAEEHTILPGFSTEPTQFSAHSLTPAGGSAAHDNRQPFLAFTFCICHRGMFPSRA